MKRKCVASLFLFVGEEVRLHFNCFQCFFTLFLCSLPSEAKVSLSVGLSVCRSVGLSVCRSVGLSVCRSVGLSVCRTVGRSIPSVRPGGRSVCRSVCRSVGRSVWSSIQIWTNSRLKGRSKSIQNLDGLLP